MNRPSLFILMIFALLLFAFAFSGCGDNKPSAEIQKRLQDSIARSRDMVVALAEIQPEKKIISLYAQTGGSVARVFHDIGDTVKKGELIAVLNTSVEEAELMQAESKLATQRDAISNNKAQLASLTVKSENANLNYNRNSDLIKSGAVSRQALDDSRFSAQSAQRDVDAASANVKQASSKLNELQRDVAYAQAVLEQKKIRAPYDGTVLSLDIKLGNSINANQALGDFAPAGPIMAVAEVDELYAQSIKVGMIAYIRPQGKSDTLAIGKVFLVSPYLDKKSLFSDDAANMEDRRVREVRVLLNEGGKVLIGSRLDCVIKVK